MKTNAILFCACLCTSLAFLAAPLRAASLSDDLLAEMAQADVIILGEVHDNPGHHDTQLQAVEALTPSAMVWEMLSEETVARFKSGWLAKPGNMEIARKWAEAEWPGFAMYVPILKATRDAAVYGALIPRRIAQMVMERGIAVVFGSGAARYGLMVALPKDEKAAREREQMEAHCNALPVSQLPMMVDFQRLRDAVLARAAVQAFDDTGGPVIVITGNGHARKDRGAPAVLARVRPGIRVFALGQSEDGMITGDFDAVVDSPAVDRPDPCAAFDKQD